MSASLSSLPHPPVAAGSDISFQLQKKVKPLHGEVGLQREFFAGSLMKRDVKVKAPAEPET
jgi:hypothetical protein